VLVTWVIYKDSEFKGGELMMVNTSLVLAGSLVMMPARHCLGAGG